MNTRMEIELAMKTEDEVKKKDDADIDDGEPAPAIPTDYVCVDPEQGALAFEFFRNLDEGDKEAALVHLRLCLHCREAVATLLKINRYMDPKAEHYLHAEKAHQIEPNAGSDETELCAQTGEGEMDCYTSNPSVR